MELTLLLATFAMSASGLNVISRAKWGARPSQTQQLLAVNPPNHVVIHHSGTTRYDCSTSENCKAVVRKIQNFHMDGNHWKDIGYNFLVGEDGNVYEGRGWLRWGAHSPGFNRNSIGICIIGGFTNKLPPQQQLKATKDLIAFGIVSSFISRDYKLVGHRQDASVKTSCPGNKLFEEIQHWDHFTNKL